MGQLLIISCCMGGILNNFTFCDLLIAALLALEATPPPPHPPLVFATNFKYPQILNPSNTRIIIYLGSVD